MEERDIPAVPHAAGATLSLAGIAAIARPSGALWLPAPRMLAVADLHLGKSERLARRGGPFLPPYDTAETLSRLTAEIAALEPERVLCLGDSFDDPRAAAALAPEDQARLTALVAARRWLWITGNHDPTGPDRLGGAQAAEAEIGALRFRHIARSAPPEAGAVEISGHYHPKATLFARGRRLSRRCFLAAPGGLATAGGRLILPAFGCYTGGLDAADSAFDPLFPDGAVALLIGREVRAIPRAALSAPDATPRRDARAIGR